MDGAPASPAPHGAQPQPCFPFDSEIRAVLILGDPHLLGLTFLTVTAGLGAGHLNSSSAPVLTSCHPCLGLLLCETVHASLGPGATQTGDHCGPCLAADRPYTPSSGLDPHGTEPAAPVAPYLALQEGGGRWCSAGDRGASAACIASFWAFCGWHWGRRSTLPVLGTPACARAGRALFGGLPHTGSLAGPQRDRAAWSNYPLPDAQPAQE